MSLLYPVLAQVLLTLLLHVRLGAMRVAAVRSRQVRLREVALSGEAYPESARKVANNVRNQSETPLLFFVLCAVAIYVGATGTLMTVLAWAYVATRIVHAAIHLTHNRVERRVIPFALGLAVLIAMWVVVAARVITA